MSVPDPRAFDPSRDEHVEVYDELPLWSALAGGFLLEHVPLTARSALDLGCGAGFPLLELAERLGPSARVVGLDPWTQGLARARRKRERWPVQNADLVCGDGARLPFLDAAFDLVVSNLGINNFEDPDAALAEVRRVLRPDGAFALTTNRAGHMRELYEAFERALAGDEAARARLRIQVERRGTVDSLRARVAAAGLERVEVREREATLRFASAAALFEHHFMRLGFRGGWEEIAGNGVALDHMRDELERSARTRGELRLTVPLVYLEARRPAAG